MSCGNERRAGSETEREGSGLILDALNLNHGRGFGRRYFTRLSRENLRAALSELVLNTDGTELGEALRRLLDEPGHRGEVVSEPESAQNDSNDSGQS